MLLLLWHWKTFYCHIALRRKRPALHVLSWVNPLQVECWLMILLWFPNQAAAMQSNRLFNLPPFSIPALSRPVQVPTWVWKKRRSMVTSCLSKLIVWLRQKIKTRMTVSTATLVLLLLTLVGADGQDIPCRWRNEVMRELTILSRVSYKSFMQLESHVTS